MNSKNRSNPGFTEGYEQAKRELANEALKAFSGEIRRLTKAYRDACAEVELRDQQLTACYMASLSNTRKSAQELRKKIHPSYKHYAYEAVCETVDREMALREKLEEVCRANNQEVPNLADPSVLEAIRKTAQSAWNLSPQTWWEVWNYGAEVPCRICSSWHNAGVPAAPGGELFFSLEAARRWVRDHKRLYNDLRIKRVTRKARA
jgi:hypothetical protein